MSIASVAILLGLHLHRQPYRSWIIKLLLVVNSKAARPALNFTSAPPQSPSPWQHTGVYAYQWLPLPQKFSLLMVTCLPALSQQFPTTPSFSSTFSISGMPAHFSQVFNHKPWDHSKCLFLPWPLILTHHQILLIIPPKCFLNLPTPLHISCPTSHLVLFGLLQWIPMAGTSLYPSLYLKYCTWIWHKRKTQKMLIEWMSDWMSQNIFMSNCSIVLSLSPLPHTGYMHLD